MPRQFIQHDWIFVIEDSERVWGVLVTAPAHGLVMLMRCALCEGAPATALGRLLHGAFGVLRLRGYHMWITVLDPTTQVERELYRVSRRWGAEQWPSPAVVMVGLTSRNRRAA